MRKLFTTTLVVGAALTTSLATASVYFTDAFNTNPVLSPVQAPNTWYIDRYAPANFDAFNPGDGNHLRIGISSADGLLNRPLAYQSTFYNTQGRKYDLGNGVYTSLKAKLYVASDWSTQLRRSDIWGTCSDLSNAVSAYPIIGFANIDRTTLMCRVWSNAGAGAWINVSAQVPGGVTTNRWYSLEIRLKPGVFEYRVDDKIVYSDAQTFGSVKFDNVIMQGYNFNDPSLAVPGVNESYSAYWDDFAAGPCPNDGYPVDLTGSYRSASSGPLNPLSSSQSGFAVAGTIPIGFGNVFERSGTNAISDNAVNGSFTPFNDSTKLPTTLFLATANDANGTKFESDIDLSGTWKPFQWGQGVGNIPPFATGDTFAVGMTNSFNSFGVQVVTNLSGQYVVRIASEKLATGSIGVLETNGSPAVLPLGTTRIRVNGTVSGGFFSGTAMPLDGPNALTVYTLGTTNGTNLDTNVPWALTYDNIGFVAGFETLEHVAAAANATVTSFTTDAVPNAMFSYADDPYVRSVDPTINYRIGQANLAQAITGFQAFMNASAGQSFGSGAYNGPYSTFNPVNITGALDAAGAESVANQSNSSIVSLVFTPGGAEVSTGTGFRPNAGTQVNLFSEGPPNFNDVVANTSASNTVLIDNTAPTLTVPALSGSAYSAPNVTVGTLLITMDATDLGARRSGLAGRPAGTITWSNATTTPVSTISLIGNTFQASIPITASTPNGTATLNVQVTDRAGNTASQVLTFNVTTVNVLLTLVEIGVSPSTVSRVVDITLGSNGGSSAPITVRKVVTFNTPVIVTGTPSMQGSTLITYQDLDLGDDAVANNSVNSAAVLTLAYAKDSFFSLGKMGSVTGSLGSFSGTLNLTMGDLTNNNVVNVSDLAVWAANNGTAMNPNTTLAQPATPRQANVDGTATVNLGDRNLIISAWLFAGDTNIVGNFRDPGNGRKDGSQLIADVVAETGLSLKVVRSMDMDRDGWITRAEVMLWRPSF